MQFTKLIAAATALAGSALANSIPHLDVPQCPEVGKISYAHTVPDRTPFPKTEVALCYDETAIAITFTALEEQHFFYNESQTTNDPIWAYEVMEAFISRGREAPRTYLEFEVSPGNVTFNAFIYNPSKVRDPAAAWDTMYLQMPVADGLVADTVLDRDAGTWVSETRIPLGLFNVDDGKAKGECWRMNFFRTVVDPQTFPNQTLGAWNPPDEASFHKTPFFGDVTFV